MHVPIRSDESFHLDHARVCDALNIMMTTLSERRSRELIIAFGRFTPFKQYFSCIMAANNRNRVPSVINSTNPFCA